MHWRWSRHLLRLGRSSLVDDIDAGGILEATTRWIGFVIFYDVQNDVVLGQLGLETFHQLAMQKLGNIDVVNGRAGLGLRGPDDHLSIAQTTGLITEIGKGYPGIAVKNDQLAPALGMMLEHGGKSANRGGRSRCANL